MDDAKKHFKDIFTAKNITRMAVFTALSFILYMPIFEFYIIPAVPFLKVDFSNAFVMMAGFALGPVAGIIVGVLKELLHALTFSQTVGVGELANIIIMLPFVLIPSIAYRYRRRFKTVIIALGAACLVQAVWSVPVNYVLTFPFFLMAYAGAPTWSVGMEFYLSVWYWAVLFNLVKTILISAATLVMYKQFQRLFNYIFRSEKKSAASGTFIYNVGTAKRMERLGESLAKTFSGGEVVLLTGELGAGKTVFCKGIAKGLGIKSPVVSPTFTLMNEYVDGRVKLCHFDAYRLTDEDEARGAGLDDFIGDGKIVCAVEWWENISGLFDGHNTVSVKIEKRGENAREVTITR